MKQATPFLCLEIFQLPFKMVQIWVYAMKSLSILSNHIARHSSECSIPKLAFQISSSCTHRCYNQVHSLCGWSSSSCFSFHFCQHYRILQRVKSLYYVSKIWCQIISASRRTPQLIYSMIHLLDFLANLSIPRSPLQQRLKVLMLLLSCFFKVQISFP